MDQTLKGMVMMSLFGALIAAGAYLSIPVGPVPVVMATLFVILGGLLLGPYYGAGAVGIYLILGLLGLPVFANGSGGIQVLAGPTGGYLAGYLLAALTAGWVVRLGKGGLVSLILASLLATAVIYVPGLLWLHRWFLMSKDSGSWSWNASLATGILPFLLGDGIKALMAVILTRFLREHYQNQSFLTKRRKA